LDIQVRQWWICMLLFSADQITQYTVGLATDVPVEFLTVGDVYLAPAFLNTIAYLASIPNPPSVVTTSYIANEAQFSLSDAQFVSAVRLFLDLTHAHQQEYLCWLHGAWRSRHLGDQYPPARIFSFKSNKDQVIFASGDGGVRGAHDSSDQCSENTFIPVFPATCPYGTQGLRSLWEATNTAQ
jgi:tripeptidyl-peptidase-1